MANKTSFGFDRAEDSPGLLLWQTTATWQRLIKRALDPFKVSHTHHVILAILLWHEEHQQKVTQIKIVKWSKLDKMTISNALKKLVAEGYITRHEHDADTRAKRVELTNEGRILAQKLVPIVEAVDAAFFGKLTNQDEQDLIKALRHLSIEQFE